MEVYSGTTPIEAWVNSAAIWSALAVIETCGENNRDKAKHFIIMLRTDIFYRERFISANDCFARYLGFIVLFLV